MDCRSEVSQARKGQAVTRDRARDGLASTHAEEAKNWGEKLNRRRNWRFGVMLSLAPVG